MLHTARHNESAAPSAYAPLFVGACALVAASAILTKQAVHSAKPLPALVATSGQPRPPLTSGPSDLGVVPPAIEEGVEALALSGRRDLHPPAAAGGPEPTLDRTTRWFDGRPVRPVATHWVTVTAYSPDARSCGKFADGQTATLHSVWTNGMRLVAADPDVFAYGTMLSVPGYAQGSIVPVLDCGAAIKGTRLDVLMPTHEQALAWGVRRIAVTQWAYADGLGPTNPRESR